MKPNEREVSRARNRSLLVATLASGAARIVSVVLNTITIPVAVKSLGVDGYGLWMTITSISSFLVFADFGLSNGLVAVISEANGRSDRQGAIRAVSTTFFALLAFSVLLTIIVAATGRLVSWPAILNLTNSRLAPSVNAAVSSFLFLQIALVPLLVAQKVQMGYQEMNWTNVWQIAGSVLSFVGVFIAAWRHWGLIPFVIAFSLGPVIGQLAGAIVLFGRLRPWLTPRISAVDSQCAVDLASTGTVFMMLQLLSVVGNSSDQIILTRHLGLAAVAQYSVVQRLFSGASVIQFFLTPLWPAFGESLARGDYQWARIALRRALAASLILSFAASIGVAVFAPWIARAWVPEVASASPSVLAGFVGISLITAYGGTMSVFLNNRGTVHAQLKFYGVASIAALAAKIWLVQSLGVAAVLWGTCIGYGIFYVAPGVAPGSV